MYLKLKKKFIKIDDSTTLQSTEKHETTSVTSANEHALQKQTTSFGKTFINMFIFSVKKCITKRHYAIV